MKAHYYALSLFLLLAAVACSDDDDEPSVPGGSGGAGGSSSGSAGAGGSGAGGAGGSAGMSGAGGSAGGSQGGACGTPDVELERAPQAVKDVVNERQGAPSTGQSESIIRYDYDGKAVEGVKTIVYYVPPSPDISDGTSTLYAQDSSIICQPDGGFTGGGDGFCPDFADKRTNPGNSAEPCVVWEDPRKPK